MKILFILFILAFLIFLYDSYLGENKDCLKEKPPFIYIQILVLQYMHHIISILYNWDGFLIINMSYFFIFYLPLVLFFIGKQMMINVFNGYL